jgi:hypothetical protein
LKWVKNTANHSVNKLIVNTTKLLNYQKGLNKFSKSKLSSYPKPKIKSRVNLMLLRKKLQKFKSLKLLYHSGNFADQL